MKSLAIFLFWVAVGFLVGRIAFSEDLGLDTPVPENRPAVAAEFTYCDEPSPTGQKTIWYVVVQYANGDTLVFNAHHLHGAADEHEAMEYILAAKTQTARHLPCPPQL